jgi:hypothetical protein
MNPDVLQEDVAGIRQGSERGIRAWRRRFLFAIAEDEFANEFIPLPPLRFHGLSGCLTCRLALAILAFPPLRIIMTGPLIPGVPISSPPH